MSSGLLLTEYLPNHHNKNIPSLNQIVLLTMANLLNLKLVDTISPLLKQQGARGSDLAKGFVLLTLIEVHIIKFKYLDKPPSTYYSLKSPFDPV